MDEHLTAAVQQSRYAPGPKAERKPRVRRDEARIQRKLAAQSRVRIGHRYRYHGPSRVLRGRIVTVVGHQSRGDIYVEASTVSGVRTCSPFTRHS